MNKYIAQYAHQTVEVNINTHCFNLINDNIVEQSQVIIITDTNVFTIYCELISTIKNIKEIIVLENGEQAKSLQNYSKIINLCHKHKINKGDYIIAIGGGCVSDIAGYVAGTYLRGINYLIVPTTIIACVDAAIGGKCGINYKNHKNQIGMFYHPQSIFIDPLFLNTLPITEYNNGMAEIIKYALIADEKMFIEIENNTFDLLNIIKKCIQIKIKISEIDELDQNYRHILNFGHTIGHIIESDSNYKIKHGEAVATGMIIELNNSSIIQRLLPILKRYNLFHEEYLQFDYSLEIQYDKKYKNNLISLIEIPQIGDCTIVKKHLSEVCNEHFWKKFKN